MTMRFQHHATLFRDAIFLACCWKRPYLVERCSGQRRLFEVRHSDGQAVRDLSEMLMFAASLPHTLAHALLILTSGKPKEPLPFIRALFLGEVGWVQIAFCWVAPSFQTAVVRPKPPASSKHTMVGRNEGPSKCWLSSDCLHEGGGGGHSCRCLMPLTKHVRLKLCAWKRDGRGKSIGHFLCPSERLHQTSTCLPCRLSKLMAEV